MQFCKYTRSLSLMFSNLRSMKKPSTRYAKMRDTQVRCSKKMLQISLERDECFCLQPLTFSSKITHGEANGKKPFAPVGTSGARAFQAYSTAPTDTWALLVEGYDERRPASLVTFSLTISHPKLSPSGFKLA